MDRLCADSKILTCNEKQWKYFLRSGHWRIPGEVGIDAWKHCNVDFVENGSKKGTILLKVAVQTKSEVLACDATDTSTQQVAGKPPFQGFSNVTSMAKVQQALLHSILQLHAKELRTRLLCTCSHALMLSNHKTPTARVPPRSSLHPDPKRALHRAPPLRNVNQE